VAAPIGPDCNSAAAGCEGFLTEVGCFLVLVVETGDAWSRSTNGPWRWDPVPGKPVYGIGR
jgi:hypothetical protein